MILTCYPSGNSYATREAVPPHLPPGGIDIPGLPDGLAQRGTRSCGRGKKALESGDQLVLYGVTVGKMSQSLGLPVKLHFAIVTKAKTPVIQLLPVPTNPDRVTLMKESIMQVWQAIQMGNFYPNPSPQNCTTCPFRSRCPVFGGG